MLRSCFRCGVNFRSAAKRRLCLACAAIVAATRKVPKPLNPDLTFREKQVVRLVAEAKANKIIAYELHLSEGTVKGYLHRIYRKLGTTDRVALAVWAVKHLEESAA